MQASPKKILVIGPAWVGDMVMAQTLFTCMKTQDPACEIHVLAPGWSQPLLDRMPEVSEGMVLPVGHKEVSLMTRMKIGRSLRKDNYDQAILLPNSWKSALIPWFAKIPLRTGWVGEQRYGLLNDVRKLDKTQYPLMIERFMALGLPAKETLNKPYPKPKLCVTEDNIHKAQEKYGLQRDKPVLALCPGAEFGPAKRWPEEYYAVVAQEKLAQGYDVYLFGSPKDQPVAAAIQGLTQQRCVDLTGKTSLAEAIDLIATASIVVSNDSGLMHIAAAMQRPTVVIYGSSSPKFTPPLHDEVRVTRLGIECSPCFQRTCPLHHLKCLKDLKPQMVLDAMAELGH